MRSPQFQIAAVILAAGESSRLGQPKQLIQFRGETLVRRMVNAASEAGCQPILVVLGNSKRTSRLNSPSSPRGEAREHEIELVEAIGSELKKTGATIVANPNWKCGIGTSIRAGMQNLVECGRDLDAVILLVCDQPLVEKELIEQLIACYGEAGKTIIASSYSGTLGVPAFFDRSHFEELLTLADDSGGKSIIISRRESVVEFPFPPGNLDIDTLADYERLIAKA